MDFGGEDGLGSKVEGREGLGWVIVSRREMGGKIYYGFLYGAILGFWRFLLIFRIFGFYLFGWFWFFLEI